MLDGALVSGVPRLRLVQPMSTARVHPRSEDYQGSLGTSGRVLFFSIHIYIYFYYYYFFFWGGGVLGFRVQGLGLRVWIILTRTLLIAS